MVWSFSEKLSGNTITLSVCTAKFIQPLDHTKLRRATTSVNGLTSKTDSWVEEERYFSLKITSLYFFPPLLIMSIYWFFRLINKIWQEKALRIQKVHQVWRSGDSGTKGTVPYLSSLETSGRRPKRQVWPDGQAGALETQVCLSWSRRKTLRVNATEMCRYWCVLMFC